MRLAAFLMCGTLLPLWCSACRSRPTQGEGVVVRQVLHGADVPLDVPADVGAPKAAQPGQVTTTLVADASGMGTSAARPTVDPRPSSTITATGGRPAAIMPSHPGRDAGSARGGDGQSAGRGSGVATGVGAGGGGDGAEAQLASTAQMATASTEIRNNDTS